MNHDMDNSQIENALTRLFDEEEHRIIFWNDPDQEFATTLGLLNLPEGVNILRLDQVGAFEAKARLEQDDPEGRYLVYTPTEEPDYEDDWLLDIRLYSRPFRADRASMILDELGLRLGDVVYKLHLSLFTPQPVSNGGGGNS